MGEAKLDGDAALFFLRETVRVGAGEGLDEGGLAVVDMTCGADDVVAGHLVRKF